MSQRSIQRSLLFTLLLTGALTVGLVACDSGGSSNEDSGENGGGGVAQTYTVTVENFDSSYQYSDQNNVDVAYAIDGEVGRTITLVRGETYEFELEASVESGPEGLPHPFYMDRTAQGQGNDTYSSGVENGSATSGTVTFTPPDDAPNALYYVCGNHAYMGGDIEITDPSGDSGDDGGDY